MNLKKTTKQAWKCPARALGLVAAMALAGFSTVASATAVFDATSTLSIKIASVLNSDTGADASDTTSIVASSSVPGDFVDSLAGATGTNDFSMELNNVAVQDPTSVTLTLGTEDEVTWTATTEGSAGPFSAVDTYLFVDAILTVELIGDILQPTTVTIEYSWSTIANASVDNPSLGELASAGADIDGLDDLDVVDILGNATADTTVINPDSDSDDDSGTWVFDLFADGSPNTVVWTYVDVYGSATGSTPGTAPEPTTLALMGLGLAGLGYRRRRNKKAG